MFFEQDNGLILKRRRKMLNIQLGTEYWTLNTDYENEYKIITFNFCWKTRNEQYSMQSDVVNWNSKL